MLILGEDTGGFGMVCLEPLVAKQTGLGASGEEKTFDLGLRWPLTC